MEASTNTGNEKKDICISLKTRDGKKIETILMSTVRSLMVDIEKKAVSKENFSSFLAAIIDPQLGELKVTTFECFRKIVN